MRIAAALLAVVSAILLIQLEGERRLREQRIVAAEVAHAEIAGARVNAAVMEAWAALGAAAEIASVDPDAALRSARQARAVSAAALFPGEGPPRLAGDVTFQAALRNAATSAPEAAWSGLVETGEGDALALTRRTQGSALAVALDPALLLTAGFEGGRILLADGQGRVIADSANRAVGRTLRDALGGALEGDPTGWRTILAPGPRMAAGAVGVTGGVQVVSAAPLPLGGDGFWIVSLAATLAIAACAIAATLILRRLSRAQERRASLAEARLDNVQRHFRLAVDGARAGLWTWRQSRDRIELSPRLQKMLGADADALTIGAFIALAAPEDQAGLQTAFIHAKTSGALQTSFRIDRGGQVVWMEVNGAAIDDPDAAGDSTMVGAVVDVTARREAELRSVALERRLKEAIESFSGPFALYDNRRRISLWNASFAKLFKLPAGVLRVGASYEEIHAASRGAIKRETPDPSDEHSREIEFPGGQWLQLVERRTLDGGIVCVGVDITELKRRGETLEARERAQRKLIADLELSEGRNRELARKYEQEKRNAEAANIAKSQFLANMSHELRTPLNAINGFSEVIATEILGPVGNAKYLEYAKNILSSGQHLLEMINDILDMAKIEAGKMQIFPSPTDPADTVEQVVRMLRESAEKKGLQLHTDAKGLPQIEADQRLLRQMLINIVNNAIKFTERGAVLVRGRLIDHEVVLQVIDTGPGIPRDKLPRLGEPFAQVDAQLTRKHEGTGLGLALTKSFAELHGGRMKIESEFGKGTAVSIYLPLKAAQPAPLAAE